MKVALITGSNTGIGKAVSLTLARNGFKTWATMRDLDQAKDLAAIADDEALAMEFARLDVTDPGSMQAVVSEVVSKSGQIDVLVNNAGVGIGGPVEFLDDAVLRGTMEVNYFGPAKLTQLVLPHMRERRSGAIVMMSSIAGRFVAPVQSPYCASKFALEALSEALAAEVAQFGVRVAIIEPGVVKTRVVPQMEALKAAGLPPGFPYAAHAQRLMSMFDYGASIGLEPEDVAAVVLEAITTDTPRLRYVFGKFAEGMQRSLAEQSDEERLAMLGSTDDEAFWRLAKDVWGWD